MTVKEKRKRLLKICDSVSGEDCFTSACPISKSCAVCSAHIPRVATDSEIEAVYAHAVRLGTIKEENNP